MKTYDLASISLSVLVFDVCVLLAFAAALADFPKVRRKPLQMWLTGVVLSVAAVLLSTFSSIIPLQVRGAMPHAFLCAALCCYWSAVRSLEELPALPRWIFALIALQCLAVAVSQNQLISLVLISASTAALHFAIAHAALQITPGAWRKLGSHWVLAAGMVIVAGVLLFRIGYWLSADRTAVEITLLRATMRAIGGVTTVIASIGFLLMCLAKQNAALTEAANTDPLTQLPNRRAAFAHLDQRMAANTKGALLMLDLDHFKGINDQFGHAVGDICLVVTAQAMLHDGRNTFAARIGGEEFLLWLEGCDSSEFAQQAAEAVLARIRTSAVNVRNAQALRFTASIGCAHHQPGQSLTELMRLADECLYQAKAAGRDCVRA